MNLRETVANFLTHGSLSSLREEVARERMGTEHFRERALGLESALDSRYIDQLGWEVAGQNGNFVMTRDEQKRLNRQSLRLYLKNPLINRGVNVQVDYVFGQSVSVSSPQDAANVVLQQFWNDIQNKTELCSIEALQDKEREQQIFGELFFVFFINKLNGRAKVRSFDQDEIEEIVSDPQDSKTPWFYKRVWNAVTLDYATGKSSAQPQTAYYPDWNYNPAQKPTTIGGFQVVWENPVYHVKSGGLRRMPRGLPENYATHAWARAYVEFLENRATVASALSRFVLKFKAKTRAGVAAITEKVASSLGNLPYGGSALGGFGERNGTSAGSAAVMGEGRDVEAMSVKGATINPDEGRRFLLMVCAGSGLPETFYGDASVGSLATATSLDRPTELMMEKRRGFWTTVLSNIAAFVIRRAIMAPGNALKGKIEWTDGTPTVTIDNAPLEIKIEFPPLLEHDVSIQMSAISQAASLIPSDELMARQAMSALGIPNIDDEIKKIDFAQIAKDKTAAAANAAKAAAPSAPFAAN